MTPARVRLAPFLRPAMVGLLALTMVGAVPSPASAQLGVRRWLEKLSGPGPFTPTVIYIAPLCYGTKVAPPTAARQSNNDKKFPVPAKRPTEPGPGTLANGDSKPGFYPAWECANAYSALPNVYFYYEFSWDNGAKSNLRYAPIGGETPNPSVGLQSHIVGVTFSKWPYLEVGAGVGGFRFDPNFDNRDPFWRGALQPIRVNVRPLAIMKPEDSPWHALMFTLQSFVVLGTLTDADFGALSGTYRESNEVVWTTAVTIDVLRLISKKKG